MTEIFQLHAVPFDGDQDVVEIATWVDDGGFVGRCAPKNGAVLLQRRDWDDHALQTGIGMLFSLMIIGAIAQEALRAQAL